MASSIDSDPLDTQVEEILNTLESTPFTVLVVGITATVGCVAIGATARLLLRKEDLQVLAETTTAESAAEIDSDDETF